jgi:predicted nucleic acid-binding protein
MVRVYFDTNIIIDSIVYREPHTILIDEAIRFMLHNKINIYTSSNSIVNALYVAKSHYKIKDAESKILSVLEYCEILDATKQAIKGALQSRFKDKEDAIQYFTAINKTDYFITRNIKDFFPYQNEILPVATPKDFIKLFE